MNDAQHYIDIAMSDAAIETIFCTSKQGDVVGALSYKVTSRTTFIHSLGSKKKGTGKKLMSRLLAMSAGKDISVLSVREAVPFYEKFGFKVTRAGKACSRMKRKAI